MKFFSARNLIVFIFTISALICSSFSADASQPAAAGDKVGNALKMLEKIENQVNSRSLDAKAMKEYVEMLELEVERENFFIDELKERVKYFDQYLDMLETVRTKTAELKTKLEGGAARDTRGSGRIALSSPGHVTADQIYDLETYANFSESKKMLEDIEKEVDAGKVGAADGRELVKKLGEQAAQIEDMIEETRNGKRKVENSIIKMLEVRLRSKNLLDKFYKNLKAAK